jgi:hypothetical protein
VGTFRAFVDAGGLFASDEDYAAMARRSAWYVDQILKGAAPGEAHGSRGVKGGEGVLRAFPAALRSLPSCWGLGMLGSFWRVFTDPRYGSKLATMPAIPRKQTVCA